MRQRLDARTVEVQLGSLRMRVTLDDIVAVETAVGKMPRETRKTKLETRPLGSVPRELHVRGLRVEEALEKVDKFLDQAVLAGHTEVRIVHGIGTGKLKQALAEFLAQHPHIESTREADREKGGLGVTLIKVKE